MPLSRYLSFLARDVTLERSENKIFWSDPGLCCADRLLRSTMVFRKRLALDLLEAESRAHGNLSRSIETLLTWIDLSMGKIEKTSQSKSSNS